MLISVSNIALILSGLALLLGAYSVWQAVSLNRLRKIFFAGSQGLDVESVILTLEQELKSSRARQEVLEHELMELRSKLGFAIQKLGLVRFNPFQAGGGNFSFCLAILDEHNSGVVLTSMHGRQQNRIYTKKIDNGKCDTQLTEEEIQAVHMANNTFLESATDKKEAVKTKAVKK